MWPWEEIPPYIDIAASLIYHLEWIDLSKFSPWLLVSDSSLVYRLCHTIIHGHPYLSQQKRQRLDTRIVRHTLGRRSAARPYDPALHRQVGPPPWPLWSRSVPYVDRVFSMACDPWLQQLPLLSSNRPRETSPSRSRHHMFQIFMPTWQRNSFFASHDVLLACSNYLCVLYSHVQCHSIEPISGQSYVLMRKSISFLFCSCVFRPKS